MVMVHMKNIYMWSNHIIFKGSLISIKNGLENDFQIKIGKS